MKVYVVCKTGHVEYDYDSTYVDIKFITSSEMKAKSFVKKNPRYEVIEKLFTPKKYHLVNYVMKNHQKDEVLHRRLNGLCSKSLVAEMEKNIALYKQDCNIDYLKTTEMICEILKARILA